MEQDQNQLVGIADQNNRLKIIHEIRGTENQRRLQNSQEEWDVYSGNIKPYVEEKITDRFNASLVKEVPIVSAINILKKTVDSRASLYKSEPERTFTELSEEQLEVVERIYSDMRIDFTMLEANKLYELQKKQTHVIIEPKRGKLIARPIKAHQVNVVPSERDPELGEVYVFSGYNKELNTNKARIEGQNNTNEKIGDYDDYEALLDRFIWWSKEWHFVTNGKGEVITDDSISPLLDQGVIPVVEITALKDFSYWREETNDVAEFCVDYNMHQSMLGQVVELQGFAQAYLKAPEELMPTYIDVGPNRVLKLITNPNMEGDVEFGYANPSSDIAAAQQYNESLLAQFLSSQGLDANTISGQAQADKFGTGVERLLAQIEKFEASKETMAIFKDAEAEVYKVVKAWHNVLKDTDQLLPKYKTQELSEDSEVVIKYKEPQHLMSESEKLDIAERKVDLGVWDIVDATAYLEDMTREQAKEMIENIASSKAEIKQLESKEEIEF